MFITENPLPSGIDLETENSAVHVDQNKTSGARYIQGNRFFEGLICLMPIAILLWVVIIWGLYTYFFA
jgi:hypothetical protein